MIQKIQKGIKSESGVIFMASTLGIFILLSFFAFFLARFAATETRSGAYHVMDIKARNLAMTGLEHGMQSFKAYRNTATVSGDFNTGIYESAFDTLYTENNTALPYTNYITIKSIATISDVERNLRLIVSSMPEAFCFSYYGNNAGGVAFAENTGAIAGDMYHNGDVNTNVVSSGTIYNSTGNGGTLLASPPPLPALSTILYEELHTAAASLPTNDYALNFDGNNDYVDAGSGSLGGNFTVSCWIKPATIATNWAGFVCKNEDKASGEGVFWLGQHSTNGKVRFGVYLNGTNESALDTDGAVISNGSRYHVAATYDGHYQKIYIDGTLVKTSSDLNTAQPSGTSNYYIGLSTAAYFNGSIDEAAIWDEALTAVEVLGLYNNGTPLNAISNSGDYSSSSDLTSYWKFNEGTGTTITDQTSNDNDGTITGATWTDGLQSTSYTNTTINLSSLTNSQLLHNGNMTLTGTTVNGPGYLVADGDLTIESSSAIKRNVFLICSGNLTLASSTIGTGIRSPAIIYAKGTASLSSSTVYGLIIVRGSSCTLNQTAVYGGILNYGATFSLDNTSSVTGSVVSNYSIDLIDANSSITKGSLPPFFGLDIGLNPMVVPGSYLEY